MNRMRKWQALAAGLAAMAGLAGCGAWYAWETGRLGNNPRALTPQAAARAAQRQVLHTLAEKGVLRNCLRLDLLVPEAEHKGMPGMAFGVAPGTHAVTLLAQAADRQPARDQNLAQYNYLAAQGLLDATPVALMVGSAEHPAVRYRLTWEGYKFLHGSPAVPGMVCLHHGRREMGDVVSLAITSQKQGDLDVYEAEVRTSVNNVPAWAVTADARRLFGPLEQALADRTEKALVVRTSQGWRPLFELAFEQQAQGAGRDIPPEYMAQVTQRLTVEAPSFAQARELVAARASDPQWIARYGAVCLPIRLRRGGDDEAARRGGEGEPFVAVYHDRPDRQRHEYRSLAPELQLLAALEASGLATLEVVRPALADSRGRARPPVAAVPAVTTLRYTVRPEVVSGFRLAGGEGCIPAGRLKVDLLQISAEQALARGAVRGVVEQVPDWARALAARLPALQSMLDSGIAVRAEFWRTAEGKQPGWELRTLEPVYPVINYELPPQRLASLMPNTFQATPRPYGGQPVVAAEAPAATAPLPVLQIEAAPLPQEIARGPSMHPAPAMPAMPSPGLLGLALPPPAPPAWKAQFPAGSASVHAVAGYSAPGGVAHVQVDEGGAVLLLWAYDAVEWRVRAPRGVKQVIAFGYEPPRLVYDGLGQPPLTVVPRSEWSNRFGPDAPFVIPRKLDRNEQVDIGKLVQAITGKTPDSVQLMAQAGPTVVGASAPKLTIPAAQEFKGAKGPVKLVSIDNEAVEGAAALRGESGAYTSAWTDRAFSAGHGYFEGTMRVTGAPNAHTFANIGLCMLVDGRADGGGSDLMVLGHAEQRLYKDGDVFGVAVDFARQRVHYRVNGQWLDTPPGGPGGRKLQPGKEYHACASSSGTTSGDVKKGTPRSDTTWLLNFGGQPFKYAPPPGFVPLQESGAR